MNQSQNGYSYQRGWAVPALGVLGGIVFVFGGGWLILSSLFSEVGTKAAATIVMIAGSCGVSGILLALVVVAIVHQIREPKVQVQAPIQTQYEILPPPRRAPALLPASGALTRYQSAPMASDMVELRMADGHGEMVALAAVEMVLAMNPVRRPKGWPHSNESYSWIKRWAIENRYLRADEGRAGEWIDREKMRQVVHAWTDR